MVLPQVDQILMGAGLWRRASEVVATLAESHRPIGYTDRRPEDRGNAKASFQTTTLDDMRLPVLQTIRHASRCTPRKWARLDQALFVESRALVDDERAIVGELDPGGSGATADDERGCQHGGRLEGKHTDYILVVVLIGARTIKAYSHHGSTKCPLHVDNCRAVKRKADHEIGLLVVRRRIARCKQRSAGDAVHCA